MPTPIHLAAKSRQEAAEIHRDSGAPEMAEQRQAKAA